MYLDLCGPWGLLGLGHGGSEELGLDPRLQLGGGIGHLLLARLGRLHGDLLGAHTYRPC